MANQSPQFSLEYYPVPKNACTTIKHAIFELENQREFKNFIVSGKTKHSHNIYPSKPFSESSDQSSSPLRSSITSFGVYRDPIKRFLSAYSNRFLHHNELSADHLKYHELLKDLKPKPDLDYFIDHINDYMKVPTISHHMAPQVRFLGKDPTKFSLLVNINKLKTLQEFLTERSGKKIKFRHLQTGGETIPIERINERRKNILNDLYREDFKFIN